MNYEAIAVWSQVVSSVLFIGVLIWLFQRFLLPVVMSAQRAKNDEIATAERRRDEAKAKAEALHAEIRAAESDAHAIAERTAIQATRERGEALEEAKEAGERLLVTAGGELARRRLEARDALRAEMLEKALGVAQTKARARVDARVDGKLVERLAATLDRGGLN